MLRWGAAYRIASGLLPLQAVPRGLSCRTSYMVTGGGGEASECQSESLQAFLTPRARRDYFLLPLWSLLI